MPYQSEYRRALYAARAHYERELREDLIQALYMEYAYTIEQIYADVLREAVSASRAGALTESIMRRLIELGERLGYTLDRSLYDAAGLAASAHAEGLERAVRATGVSVRASFTDVPHRAIEMMMVRRAVGGQARTFRTLINRRIEAMAPDGDRLLSSSIATGGGAARSGGGWCGGRAAGRRGRPARSSPAAWRRWRPASLAASRRRSHPARARRGRPRSSRLCFHAATRH